MEKKFLSFYQIINREFKTVLFNDTDPFIYRVRLVDNSYILEMRGEKTNIFTWCGFVNSHKGYIECELWVFGKRMISKLPLNYIDLI